MGIEPTDPRDSVVSPPTLRDMPVAVALRVTIWPTVLGVIAIVFGSLAILGGCFGLFTPLFIAPLSKVTAQQQGPNPLAFMDDWMAWIIAAAALTMVVAGPLLAGGIALLRRAPASRPLILVWVAAKMLFVLVSVSVNYQMQQDQFAAMAEADAKLGAMQAFMVSIGVLSVVIGVIWGWALPVFMLIWLSRGSIRAEVSSWPCRDQSAASAIQ